MIQGSRLIKEHVQCVHYVDIRHVFFGNYAENNSHCSRLHLEAIINQISKYQLQNHAKITELEFLYRFSDLFLSSKNANKC